jgi:predicted acylesterase/phospholipase RssA
MFGLRPDGVAGAGLGAAGAAFWACASAPEVNVAAATSVDVPKRMLRRLMDLLPAVSDDIAARSLSCVFSLI